jgi:hypothetical protein
MIAKLSEDAYSMRVDNRVTEVPPPLPGSELMNPDTMKLAVAVQQMVDATAPVENNPQTPIVLGPQLEGPPRVATARRHRR